MIDPQIENSWREVLSNEFQKDYFKNLKQFLIEEINAGKTIYPHPKNIFAAFNTTTFHNVRVVILGQDPYHGPKQAHGLCFSVPEDQKKIPPSLKNIYKEIYKNDMSSLPSSGNLEHWTKEGVFLLNATLTVEAGQAGSHQNKGWEEFTDSVIKKISEEREGVIFLLWGAYAQKKANIIDTKKHKILTAPHPSPLSAHRGFFGCDHFEKVNTILQKRGERPIEWMKK